MLELYLNPTQVKRLIKKAEREEEVIVIRCVRKTPASKPGGPDKDELYDLHCATKPNYKSATKPKNKKSTKSSDTRIKEDRKNGVLTVFVTNRKNPRTKTWGAWRRVNIKQVKKIIYRTKEYEVTCK